MKNILCVDDYLLGLQTRQAILQMEGYEVEITTNPEVALRMISDGANFDLIIVDYTMPEMSGATLVELIRNRKPSIPIIMYSGALPSRYIDCDVFLEKAQPRELVYHVKKILGEGYVSKPRYKNGK